jgi:uncharacterized protein (DUF1800 family)
MTASKVLHDHAARARRILLIGLGCLSALTAIATAQINTSVNQSVWQMLFGVTNAQINNSSWLSADADGDGLTNAQELIAGTNPFQPTSMLGISTVSVSGTNSTVTFPTVTGKLYTVQGTAHLNPTSWQTVTGASVTGDGTIKTLTVANSAGPFFHVVVQDQSTANDGVSDWAKNYLGFPVNVSISAPLNGSGGYSASTLASNLSSEFSATTTVTVVPTVSSATQPASGSTASSVAVVTFTRSGQAHNLSTLTVPIVTSGTAVSGTDYTALPTSVTFPPGVGSVSVNITPLANASRVNTSMVTVTAQAGTGYVLGTPASASVNLYPASNIHGSGLLGQYFIDVSGQNPAYTNGASSATTTVASGDLGATSSSTNSTQGYATYVYTQTTSTTGTIVVTLPGVPGSPYFVGQLVNLVFNSGPLGTDVSNAAGQNFTTEFNSTTIANFNNVSGSVNATTVPNLLNESVTQYVPVQQYVITALGSNTFTVSISANGITLPASGSGSVTVAPFAARSNANKLGGLGVSYTWTKGTNTGTAVISYTGTPTVNYNASTGIASGSSVTLQFTSGGLFESGSGPYTNLSTYDGTYTISSPVWNSSTKVGSFSVTLNGTNLPASSSGSATLAPFTAPAALASNGNATSRIDPTVDFIWGSGQPPNTSMQTVGTSNDNWAARWDGWINPPSTGSYTFQVQTNDGARVYVNGTLVINAWAVGSASATPMQSSTITLTAGTPAFVRVEYYHLDDTIVAGTFENLDLTWELPGASSFTNIPDNVVFLSSTGSGANGWTGLYWIDTGSPSNTGAQLPAPGYSTVSISSASPAVVTWTNHGLMPSTPIVFSGSVPTGITAGATYYVLANALTTNSFEVSTTPGGAAVNTTSTGTPTAQTYTPFLNLPRYGDYPGALNAIAFTSTPSNSVNNGLFFSTRWDGFIVPTTTGSYTFQVTASDGARVYVDTNAADVASQNNANVANYKILDAWTAGPDTAATTPATSSSVNLTAGVAYPFRVEYYQSGNATVTENGYINLTWELPGASSYTAIPATDFYRPDPLTGSLTFTNGLWAKYYNNITLSDPPGFAGQDTGDLNGTAYSYGLAKPSSLSNSAIGSDNWSARFDTYFVAPANGTYNFQLFAASAGQVLIGPPGSTIGASQVPQLPTYEVAPSETVSISTGVPAVITLSNHGLAPGTPVIFSSTGSLPTGLTAGTTYYVIAPGITASAFEVSATPGGTAVNTTVAGSGTQTVTANPTTFTYGTALTAGQIVPISVLVYNANSTGSNVQATLNYNTSTLTGAYSAIPSGNLYQNSGATTPGVVASYWANTSFIGDPSFKDYKTTLTYSTTGAPSDSWTVRPFSAAWDGYIQTPTGSNNTGAYLFSLQAQYQAKITVNGTVVCDGWTTPGSAATTPVTGTISLTAGTRYPIHVDFISNTTGGYLYVMWQPPGQSSLTTVPNTVCFTDAATSTQQGLLATYYANNTQASPFFYQVVENNNPELDYYYGAGSPDPNIPNTYYSAVWTGQVVPQYTEQYYFATRTDDGARLWVNGQLVIDRWQSQSVAEYTSPPLSLNAGTFYDIRMEYLQLTGGSEAHLLWYSNDQSEQVIPSNCLYPAATGQTGAAPTSVTSTANDVYTTGSGSNYTYTIAGSNGASYSVSGLPAGLSLNGNVISGNITTPGTYQFTVTVTDASGTTSQVVTLQVVSAVGNITREVYQLANTAFAVSDLQDAISAGAAHTTDATLTTLESTNAAYSANTGERLRGYFTAPTTGNYYFWVAGSGGGSDANHHVAEFWLSDTSEPVAKIRRCYVSGPSGTASRTWDAQTSQKSPWISLVGGQQYYFEILHNTGSVTNSTLSVAWYLDPTGNTASPITDGANAAAASTGGIVPNYVLSPWNNPPTITTPGTVYVAPMASSPNLTGIQGSGGAYITDTGTGTPGIIHVNVSGLSSAQTSARIYDSSTNPATLLFDLGAVDLNYSSTKTSDSGYNWGSVSGAVANGTAFLAIGTANHPITTANPYGELTGVFGKVSGSQTPPSLPSYTSPSWTDDHSATTAARLLNQATFGANPSDMAYITANTSYTRPSDGKTFTGCRAWIEQQFNTVNPSTDPYNPNTYTYTVPFVLATLASSNVIPFNDTNFFNAWWKNSITAPDQLRQRVAFALSEILVVSDASSGLTNNGRSEADFYDNLVQYAFDNYRNILKQVTLTSAMGVYLNMQGNEKGSYVTGLHPNENYAREIQQLFSIGLYLLWPDGSLMLDSHGDPIPTYTQPEITGFARVFTGWTWSQTIQGNGRLPTSFGPASDYLDPMVLVPAYHELGTKIILDNAILPAAVVTNSSDVTHDPIANPPPAIQYLDPVNGQGNTLSATITSAYDAYGLWDLEYTLNSIMNNPSNAPFVCRQLIQRLVTSNPQPAYVYRVVRAYLGQQNIDGVSTGVVGDMKDTTRAILLDPEARNITEAGAITFGKQREPMLRVTGPARAFPPTGIANCSYQQTGGQTIMVSTPTPHRAVNSDYVNLNSFVDSANTPPYAYQAYQVNNTTPGYTWDVNPTFTSGTLTVSAPGYQANNSVPLQFTSGPLWNNGLGTYNATYTVASATSGYPTSGSFTVNITGSGLPASGSGAAFTPNNFTVSTSGVAQTPSYTINSSGGTDTTVTINEGTSANLVAGQSVYIEFTTGGLLNSSNDGLYTVPSNVGSSSFTVNLKKTYPQTTSIASIATSTAGNPCTVTTTTAHGLASGMNVTIGSVTGGAYSTLYGTAGQSVNTTFLVTVIDSTHFTIPLQCTTAPTASTGVVTLPTGSTLIPTLSGGYTVTNINGKSYLILQAGTNFDLNVGDQIYVNILLANTPIGAQNGLYTVINPAAIPLAIEANQVVVQSPISLTAGVPNSSTAYYGFPQVIHQFTRSGTCRVDYGTWNIGFTTSGLLDQTPLDSPTVFNFFYPGYSYPGAIAQAGMTTPEFQLTDATDTLNLTNAVISGILGNTGSSQVNGYMYFFNSQGPLVLDCGATVPWPSAGTNYMTAAWTGTGNVANLVSTLGTLLCGNNLSSATQNAIVSYVDNTGNFPISSPPTNQQMSNRIRAVIQLILCSAEYAIQK